MLTDFLRNFAYIKDANSDREVYSVGQALLLIHSLANNSNLVSVAVKTRPPIKNLDKQSLDTIADALATYVTNHFTPTDDYYHCEGTLTTFSKKKSPLRYRLKISYYIPYVVHESGVLIGFAHYGINFGDDKQESGAHPEPRTHVSRRAVFDFHIR